MWLIVRICYTTSKEVFFSQFFAYATDLVGLLDLFILEIDSS